MNPNQKVAFIKDWILNYVNSMPKKAQSLVIGISGGIDSSVSSTLSAMTGLKTIVLSMPIKQKITQHDLSLKHQDWLKKNFKNVEGITVELDSLFSTFENTLKDYNLIACEFNVIPLNLVSKQFHESLDYENVGFQLTENGTKKVSLMIKKII